MRKALRRRPTPAMGVALLALFVALGGTSVALTKGEKKQIRKISKKQANKRINQKAPALSVNHANTANSVPNGSIGGSKLGSPVVAVTNPLASLPGPGEGQATVNCPPGTRLISGGGRIVALDTQPPAPAGTSIQISQPNGNGWRIRARNTGSTNALMGAEALCLAG